jgi:glutaredoxin
MSDATQAPRRHRMIGWLIVMLALVIAFQELRTPRHAEARYCEEGRPPPAQQVMMLTAAWCPYCTKARNWLVAQGVPYCEYDIERSPTGAARYAQGGIKVIPQIFIGERVLVGFNRDELEQTLAAHDLLPMPE